MGGGGTVQLYEGTASRGVILRLCFLPPSFDLLLLLLLVPGGQVVRQVVMQEVQGTAGPRGRRRLPDHLQRVSVL